MLLNKDRSNRIMDKYKLDALVAREHINIYYLSDYWDTQADGRWPYLVYAVLPREETNEPSLIIPSVKLERLSVWPTWINNIIPYSDYSGREHISGNKLNSNEPVGAKWSGWPVKKGANLTELELHWINLANKYKDQMAATSTWALYRSLKESNLDGKRIGSDDPRVLEWIKSMGLNNIEIVDATNIFREIRMIKSTAEIQNLRLAAKVNEKACLDASTNLNIGDTWDMIEKKYHISMSEQGGRNGHIITSLGGLPEGKIIEGKPFLVDALGEYKNYFGDFGRTVILGEPSKELRIRADSMMNGLKETFNFIKPGIRKSEIISKVIEVVRKSGFPEFFYVSPHSLGLEHTDQPIPLGSQIHNNNTDFVVEKNMILNIDMPYFEWGWGTMHLEDTILVNDNNIEFLTSMSDPLIIN